MLLKQRTLLHSEKLAHRAKGQSMPDPSRLTKTKKAMGRLKAVLSERAALEGGETGQELRAFVDAL